jgi:hypothetical protein
LIFCNLLKDKWIPTTATEFSGENREKWELWERWESCAAGTATSVIAFSPASCDGFPVRSIKQVTLVNSDGAHFAREGVKKLESNPPERGEGSLYFSVTSESEPTTEIIRFASRWQPLDIFTPSERRAQEQHG